jgi:hypothetical protein
MEHLDLRTIWMICSLGTRTTVDIEETGMLADSHLDVQRMIFPTSIFSLINHLMQTSNKEQSATAGSVLLCKLLLKQTKSQTTSWTLEHHKLVFMERNFGHLESQPKSELTIDFCTREADLISQSKVKSANTGLQFLRKHLQSFMVTMLAHLVETQQEESLISLVHQAK